MQRVGALVLAALAARQAEVGLRGLQRGPVGGLGEAAGFDAARSSSRPNCCWMARSVSSVGALAEVVESDLAVAAHEVDGRPIVVLEGPPDRETVVDDDRVADAQFACGAAHVVDVVLEAELGRVHADDDEARDSARATRAGTAACATS